MSGSSDSAAVDLCAVVHHIDALRAQLREWSSAGLSVGLVPTMGYLHEGHRSLVERAASDNDRVLVTVFVNPIQFAPTEDLASYPRDLDADRSLVSGSGADIVFAPQVEEMYPEPLSTTVTVSGVSQGMEGASRATHFAGVATVVAKLFNLAGPCRAYFGDLNFPVEVVGCPTVREPDGLAKSSRNIYLSAEERAAAPVLSRALRHGVSLIAAGEHNADVVRVAMSEIIAGEPLAQLDYVEVADATTLEPQSLAGTNSRLFGAVRFGRARLIDNVGVAAMDSPGDGADAPAVATAGRGDRA
jgi:pantoate--beta-alanine ligase